MLNPVLQILVADMDWVGEAVARVTGQTLGAYCKKHIFDPLGVSLPHVPYLT